MTLLTDEKDDPLVQVTVVTLDGVQYAMIGPVLYVPGLMAGPREFSDIEFGDIMPARMAARMLEGEFRNYLGGQVQ